MKKRTCTGLRYFIGNKTMRKDAIFVTNPLKSETRFKESIHAKHTLTPQLLKNIWSSDALCSALAPQAFSPIVITSSRSQPPSRQHTLTRPGLPSPHTCERATKRKRNKSQHTSHQFNTKKEKNKRREKNKHCLDSNNPSSPRRPPPSSRPISDEPPSHYRSLTHPTHQRNPHIVG